MYKDDLIKKIDDARKIHLKWLRRVKHLLEEVLVVDEMISLDPRESEFGHWLYGDTCKCQNTPFFKETFDRIEAEHIKLHQIYFEIYRIYFVETKRKGVSAIFLGERKKILDAQRMEARECYYELVEVSRRLIVQLNNLERKVRMSNYETIEKCLVA